MPVQSPGLRDQGMIMADDELRNGKPKPGRNEHQGFDKFHWPPNEHFPDGLRIQVYDDGRVKVGGWETSVAVMDVMNRGPGRSRGSSHVVLQFQDASRQDPGKVRS